MLAVSARFGRDLPTITGGLHWRVYRTDGVPRLVKEDKGPAPTFILPPGAYVVSAGFGLAYAAFDFVVTPDGRWVFLECNPGGQYGWLEGQTGLPITRQQARALLHIARNEGLSQAAIATMLDIEPIALVRLLDRLHEEGLVERRAHATDRRVRTLWLTPLGWEVVDRTLAINAEVREEACAGLSPAATT